MPSERFSIGGSDTPDSVRQKLLRSEFFRLEAEIGAKLFENVANIGYTAEHGDAWPSNRTWTNKVKRVLYRLGKAEGFLVYPRESGNSFKGEWLFDMVWVDAKPKPDDKDAGFDWYSMRGLRLACESEWSANADHVLDDFLKLTVVTANLRVFVYTNKHFKFGKGRSHAVEVCRGVCPLSRGYRYLLVGFPVSPSRKKDDEDKFRIDAWTA